MSVLDEILDGVREDLEHCKRQTSLTELRSRVADMPLPVDMCTGRRRVPAVACRRGVGRRSPGAVGGSSYGDPQLHRDRQPCPSILMTTLTSSAE